MTKEDLKKQIKTKILNKPTAEKFFVNHPCQDKESLEALIDVYLETWTIDTSEENEGVT